MPFYTRIILLLLQGCSQQKSLPKSDAGHPKHSEQEEAVVESHGCGAVWANSK